MRKAEKAFQAFRCLQYNHADASVAVNHLFSHALAPGEHKRSHMDISRAPSGVSASLRRRKSNGLKSVWGGMVVERT